MAGLASWALRRVTAGRSPLIESAASFLAGPWLHQGLVKGAVEHKLFGRSGLAALSFDVDYQADVKALDLLLNELDRHSLKASFAVVGQWVKAHTEPHRALVQAGHEVVNHTLSHPDNEELDPNRHFHLLGPEELKAQIMEAHRIIEDILSISPSGFRAPHFGHQHTEAVYPLLRELGYLYSSSTLASRSPSFGWPHQAGQGLLELPVTVCPRHPFSSFDTWHYLRRQPNRHRPGDFLNNLNMLLNLAASGTFPLSFYFDPRDVADQGVCRQALVLLAESGLEITTLRGWLEGLSGEGKEGEEPS